MKVFLNPPPHLSLAMFRVASALAQTLPDGWSVVKREDDADLLVLHVIGLDAVEYRTDKRCAVMQYCLYPGALNMRAWSPLWERAVATWSYYNLTQWDCPRFYHAPLGVADIFTDDFTREPRVLGVLTSGYVTGPGAEAIEEVTIAARLLGQRSIHLGPRPVGGDASTKYCTTGLISDAQLASVYRRTRYVSGLRFVEGFEMCAAEGLACGARPIMFSRPDAHWFGGHARYVQEQGGEALIREVRAILTQEPQPVSPEERAVIIAKFNWDTLGRAFWQKVQEGL